MPKEKLKQRKVLTLKERIDILRRVEGGRSCRSVAAEFEVGKTQIQKIVQQKEDLLKQWAEGGNSLRKYTKRRRSPYEDLDIVVWEWFVRARSKNIPVSGRLLQERAKQYSLELGYESFSASNGWLQRWQTRHNVRMAVLSGEGADVDPTVVSDWKKRLETICEGYELGDIFNADETGLFFRALPNRSLVHAAKGEQANGGKKSKDRVSVLLACSATGEKLTPVVIGRSAKPRCFRGLATTACLPVDYKSNKRAWMTSKLFEEWLDKLNQSMQRQGRSILLFVDNCSAHPDVLRSNVKLVFLPPNTTSKLQPCDAGIIQAMKLVYRKQLLRRILSLMDDASSATGISKAVNILDAILWLKCAWDAVSSVTIQKCFSKCGFNVPLRSENDSDDGDDSQTDRPAEELESVIPGVEMNWNDYAQCDDQLPTCETIQDDWEENLIEKLRMDKQDDPEDEDEDVIEISTEERSIISEESAAVALRELRDFSIAHENAYLLDLVCKSQEVLDRLLLAKRLKAKQTKITAFFE